MINSFQSERAGEFIGNIADDSEKPEIIEISFSY